MIIKNNLKVYLISIIFLSLSCASANKQIDMNNQFDLDAKYLEANKLFINNNSNKSLNIINDIFRGIP